jgi:vitamin B12 transporter
MSISLLLAGVSGLAAANSAAGSDIVVTAALVPVTAIDAPASVTVFDQQQIDTFSFPFISDLARLAPGVSVSTAGGIGAQSQIRIRGAEANHTRVVIDGIPFNDTASDDQPRFETISAGGLGRVELIRGPQSAIYGSEALGGVLSLSSLDPLGTLRVSALAEYGSDDFARGTATIVSGGDIVGVSATGSFARGDGIDVLGGGTGDKDGFSNYSGSVKLVARPGSDGEFGIVGHYIHHRAEFDGTPAPFFTRADTAEYSKAETYAVRSWAKLGLAADAPWSGLVEALYLDSANRNYDADNIPVHTNDTFGSRARFAGQLTHRFAFAGAAQTLIGRIEREDESYKTRDRQFGGFGDVDFTRARTTFVGEWLGEWGDLVSTDIAVRHDAFNRFKDSTTLRAHAIVHVTPSIGIVGGYSEGLSQPGFAELFGFARDSGFIGNPELTPERSRGFEAGVRWTTETARLEIVGFSNTLRDEIVYQGLPSTPTIMFPYTYVNADGKSRRRGVELSGEYRPFEALRISANYTYLDAREQKLAGGPRTPEIRRAKHSANLYADYVGGPLTIGGSLSYVGKRPDTDFDVFDLNTFDYLRVRLKSYVLAGARVAYAVTPNIEAFARIENAFDEKYQDSVGYATPGRTVYAGVRVRLGD